MHALLAHPSQVQDAKNQAARVNGGVASTAKRDVADFGDDFYHELWDIEHVGPSETGACPCSGKQVVFAACMLC
jgi:hypothetical protein